MKCIPIAASAMPTFGRAPQWGSKWKKFVSENAGRWLGAYAQCNSLPYENTWLDLDPEVKDPLGDPVCRITSGPKVNEPRASAHAAKKAEEWFRAAGAIEVAITVPDTEGAQPFDARHWRNSHGQRSRKRAWSIPTASRTNRRISGSWAGRRW